MLVVVRRQSLQLNVSIYKNVPVNGNYCNRHLVRQQLTRNALGMQTLIARDWKLTKSEIKGKEKTVQF